MRDYSGVHKLSLGFCFFLCGRTHSMSIDIVVILMANILNIEALKIIEKKKIKEYYFIISIL